MSLLTKYQVTCPSTASILIKAIVCGIARHRNTKILLQKYQLDKTHTHIDLGVPCAGVSELSAQVSQEMFTVLQEGSAMLQVTLMHATAVGLRVILTKTSVARAHKNGRLE